MLLSTTSTVTGDWHTRLLHAVEACVRLEAERYERNLLLHPLETSVARGANADRIERIGRGGSRIHTGFNNTRALPLLVAHEIGYARMFELGLWQLLLQVGIGAATQSYNGMPDLATWTPTRRSHQAASRSQARAVG